MFAFGCHCTYSNFRVKNRLAYHLSFFELLPPYFPGVTKSAALPFLMPYNELPVPSATQKK